MSGFGLLKWVRLQPRLASVPIVMLSGSAAALDIDQASRLGASSYLVKPVDAGRLEAVLHGDFSKSGMTS